ncbi:MAG: alpha/beta fold hydrolase [Chloroflexi bacterium]|nr:alpha/beta fold hydrolase [Chloroflexota bacterium]MCI0575515.1 alpha/beta fold hydrolase [Chloroflexota bacterium]MCI0644292.1 alpha/beta fold hydrolase [Chloroflexota bacterium]MCI0726275.1 alpha/beta fold hydrolase [Chloroflexota bacterium]
MSNLTVKEIEQEYHHLAQAGAYEQALALATREAHQFPEHAQRIVYYWRFRMAALLGEAELTLQLLDEALQAGHWYSGLEEDSDFALLSGRPEFEHLGQRCRERRAEAMAAAVPVMETLEPGQAAQPYPLLMALHGNNSTVAGFQRHWQTAVAAGWLVGLPQSSQQYGPDNYSWMDWEWSIQEAQQQWRALQSSYPVDAERVVLAGFSMGGGLATYLALSGTIQVRGLVLVAPFLPDPKNMIPHLEARKYGTDLRVYLAASEQDEYCLDVARQLADFLPRYEVACQLEVFSDLGHSFPVQLEQNLPQVLAFVTQS